MRSKLPHLDLLICVGILCSLVPNVGFALKFPIYPVRAAGEYAVKAERSGITIGIQALDDLDEQKTYFHTKLSPKGFLPVFVVIQNATSNESYIFDQTKLLLIPAGATGAGTPQPSHKAANVGMVAGLAAMSFAGAMVSDKMAADVSEIQEELMLKELHSTTISPGASVHGFLYIHVPNKGDREKVRLKIPMLKSGSDESVDLDVEF